MKISRTTLQKLFEIKENRTRFVLRYKNARNHISIDKKFILGNEAAQLAGLMPDGSLIKDLRRIYFHQKKDYRKILLFKRLLIKLFRPNNKIFIRNNRGTFDAYTNSTTLTIFLYHIVKIPKSDEQMRVPSWIFKSSRKTKISYLQQAFDMEGTVSKNLREIRFKTKDELFAYDIRKTLGKIGINSFVKPTIGGLHHTVQYRVSVYGKNNFRKFRDIGFRVPQNHTRFRQLLKKYNILPKI